MQKEIILPYHLYQRIKASAGEHGGVGRGRYFDTDGPRGPGLEGEPFCVHGHAWGTCNRLLAYRAEGGEYPEPELNRYISIMDNDRALSRAGVPSRKRIPFEKWCELLNVKCGPKRSAFVEPDPDYRAFQRDAEEHTESSKSAA